jgi:hypothetical protein
MWFKTPLHIGQVVEIHTYSVDLSRVDYYLECNYNIFVL